MPATPKAKAKGKGRANAKGKGKGGARSPAKRLTPRSQLKQGQHAARVALASRGTPLVTGMRSLREWAAVDAWCASRGKPLTAGTARGVRGSAGGLASLDRDGSGGGGDSSGASGYSHSGGATPSAIAAAATPAHAMTPAHARTPVTPQLAAVSWARGHGVDSTALRAVVAIFTAILRDGRSLLPGLGRVVGSNDERALAALFSGDDCDVRVAALVAAAGDSEGRAGTFAGNDSGHDSGSGGGGAAGPRWSDGAAPSRTPQHRTLDTASHPNRTHVTPGDGARGERDSGSGTGSESGSGIAGQLDAESLRVFRQRLASHDTALTHNADYHSTFADITSRRALALSIGGASPRIGHNSNVGTTAGALAEARPGGGLSPDGPWARLQAYVRDDASGAHPRDFTAAGRKGLGPAAEAVADAENWGRGASGGGGDDAESVTTVVLPVTVLSDADAIDAIHRDRAAAAAAAAAGTGGGRRDSTQPGVWDKAASASGAALRGSSSQPQLQPRHAPFVQKGTHLRPSASAALAQSASVPALGGRVPPGVPSLSPLPLQRGQLEGAFTGTGTGTYAESVAKVLRETVSEAGGSLASAASAPAARSSVTPADGPRPGDWDWAKLSARLGALMAANARARDLSKALIHNTTGSAKTATGPTSGGDGDRGDSDCDGDRVGPLPNARARATAASLAAAERRAHRHRQLYTHDRLMHRSLGIDASQGIGGSVRDLTAMLEATAIDATATATSTGVSAGVSTAKGAMAGRLRQNAAGIAAAVAARAADASTASARPTGAGATAAVNESDEQLLQSGGTTADTVTPGTALAASEAALPSGVIGYMQTQSRRSLLPHRRAQPLDPRVQRSIAAVQQAAAGDIVGIPLRVHVRHLMPRPRNIHLADTPHDEAVVLAAARAGSEESVSALFAAAPRTSGAGAGGGSAPRLTRGVGAHGAVAAGALAGAAAGSQSASDAQLADAESGSAAGAHGRGSPGVRSAVGPHGAHSHSVNGLRSRRHVTLDARGEQWRHPGPRAGRGRGIVDTNPGPDGYRRVGRVLDGIVAALLTGNARRGADNYLVTCELELALLDAIVPRVRAQAGLVERALSYVAAMAALAQGVAAATATHDLGQALTAMTPRPEVTAAREAARLAAEAAEEARLLGKPAHDSSPKGASESPTGADAGGELPMSPPPSPQLGAVPVGTIKRRRRRGSSEDSGRRKPAVMTPLAKALAGGIARLAFNTPAVTATVASYLRLQDMGLLAATSRGVLGGGACVAAMRAEVATMAAQLRQRLTLTALGCRSLDRALAAAGGSGTRQQGGGGDVFRVGTGGALKGDTRGSSYVSQRVAAAGHALSEALAAVDTSQRAIVYAAASATTTQSQPGAAAGTGSPTAAGKGKGGKGKGSAKGKAVGASTPTNAASSPATAVAPSVTPAPVSLLTLAAPAAWFDVSQDSVAAECEAAVLRVERALAAAVTDRDAAQSGAPTRALGGVSLESGLLVASSADTPVEAATASAPPLMRRRGGSGVVVIKRQRPVKTKGTNAVARPLAGARPTHRLPRGHRDMGGRGHSDERPEVDIWADEMSEDAHVSYGQAAFVGMLERAVRDSDGPDSVAEGSDEGGGGGDGGGDASGGAITPGIAGSSDTPIPGPMPALVL